MGRITRAGLVFLATGCLFLGSCVSARKKPAVSGPQAAPPAAIDPKAQEEKAAIDRETAEKISLAAKEDSVAEISPEKSRSPESKEAGVQLEDALSAYQEAQTAWERGDLDSALSRLDEAYGMILKVKITADSPLSQEKNDLRLLIAQRIQQIYASRLSPVGENNRTIPLVENTWVIREIGSFQTRERKSFEEAYKRSGLYRDMILEELRKAGLPEQLSWLPVIESGFKIRALSRERALGLWQFISSTGYRYGLKRDKYVDERMDPIKSTQAAIKYLSELHGFFGDWTTALASYNCGELRVQNLIRAQRIDYFDNFWDLFQNLPYETARFVPRFIAVLQIIENPEKYGFRLPQPDPPLRFETIAVEKPVKLASVASQLGLDPVLLSFLNAELRNDSTPNYPYQLRVPIGYGDKAAAAITALPKWIPPDAIYSWHYVRKGDTLGMIAKRYRTTVAAIARLNGMKTTRLIYPGQRLKIPGKGGASATEPGAAGSPSMGF